MAAGEPVESGKMTIAMLPEISGLSFGEFLNRLAGNPPLQVTTFLVLGTILVNGATDAPNAIASLVASGGMELKKAIRMAAFFNFAGLALMASWNANVAFTIYHMVDFGGDPEKALTALCAALAAIILWASAAWCFGIPTSESHALIAGLTGAAISIHKGLAGIHWGGCSPYSALRPFLFPDSSRYFPPAKPMPNPNIPEKNRPYTTFIHSSQ